MSTSIPTHEQSIKKLIDDYCTAMENGDPDAFMNCWFSVEEGFKGYIGWLGTHEELRDYIAQNCHKDGTRYIATDIKITVLNEPGLHLGRTARITHKLFSTKPGELPVFLGAYTDGRAVCTTRGWRFQSRTFQSAKPERHSLPNSALPQYQSHKILEASRILQIDGHTLICEHGHVKPKTDDYFSKHNPEVGGYFVRYQDGYESWSPAYAFELGNTRLPDCQATIEVGLASSVA